MFNVIGDFAIFKIIVSPKIGHSKSNSIFVFHINLYLQYFSIFSYLQQYIIIVFCLKINVLNNMLDLNLIMINFNFNQIIYYLGDQCSCYEIKYIFQ